MLEGYTVSEASSRTNINQQKISQLIFANVVVPEFNRPVGRGDQALLSDRNIRELNLVTQLERLGVKRMMIKEIISTLVNSKVAWWEKRGWLVVMDGSWFLTDNPFDVFNKDRIIRPAVLLEI